MATSSVETAIQTDLQTILQAISLANIDPAQANGLANITPAQVGVIREAPNVAEVIDPLPCVLIVTRTRPGGTKGSDPGSFEGSVIRAYVEEIIIIDGREGDLATWQPGTQQWYEQCIDAVQRNSDGSWRTKLPTATGVFDITVGDIEGYDRTKLGDQYAYLSFFATVRSGE